MSKHLQHEIDALKRSILSIGTMVEDALKRSVDALLERNEITAKKVIENDTEIDMKEVELEEDCLKILALHQPVAIDLRFIVALIKINSDLERIGDLAVNIAERTLFITGKPPIKVDFDFRDMANKTLDMVKDSLDSLVNMDVPLARTVCSADDEVDDMNRQMFTTALESIEKDPDNKEAYLRYMLVARHLERISDHATNIAENVIYLEEGEIVRHRMKYLNPKK